MSYRVVIKPSAFKELEALPKSIIKRLDRMIRELGENPRPVGSKKLRGWDLYRISRGYYRIIYKINQSLKEIEVVKIGHRKEVYRRF